MNPLPSIREVLNKYKISANKKLGQNFLFDQNITDKIVRSSGILDDKTVIEIGPGPGLLTRSILASKAKNVIAIEKDERCVTALNEYLVPHSNGRLSVINDNALNNNIYKNIADKATIISNLPYCISTELLFNWLDIIDRFDSFTLMFQKEVASRISAKPHTKAYGNLSIKSQLLCKIEHVFDLPPTAFFPPPKIYSSVIRIIPRDKPLAIVDIKKLEKLCKTVFGQRRKTLRSSLKQLITNPCQTLADAQIEENRRPEELSIEELCRLANNLPSDI